MELTVFFSKYKNTALNLMILIVAVIIALKIHATQNQILGLLEEEKETEITKNELLSDIGPLGKRIDAYKELFREQDSARVIENISGLAQESEVKIVSIQPEPDKDYPLYIKSYFTLVIDARNYDQIGAFVSKVENFSKIYILERTNITPITEESKEGNIEARITLSTVFLKD